MRLIIIITLSMFLFSCAKFHRVTLRTNAEGHFVPHYEKRNLRPIRDNNFNLITDRAKAQKRLDDLGSFDELEKFVPKTCDIGIKESKKYHKAEGLLQEAKFDDAIKLLDEVKGQCRDIAFVSHINYLYAYAYEKKGMKEIAQNYINLFIHKAESIYPQSFYQFDSANDQVAAYERYLSQAKNYLEGQELVLVSDAKPRYNTLEGTLLPGIKPAKKKDRFIFDIGYSTKFRGSFGIGYIGNTKYGQFIPFIITSQIGSWKSLLWRKQHFQTIDRKHTTGFRVSIDEWKKYTVYKDSYSGEINKFEIHDSGYGVTAGYGGTYQFNNDFSYVYTGSVTASYETNVFGTSMISYHTGGPSSLLAGLFKNESVVMWKVSAIQIWYNYTDKSFNSSLTAGIRF